MNKTVSWPNIPYYITQVLFDTFLIPVNTRISLQINFGYRPTVVSILWILISGYAITKTSQTSVVISTFFQEQAGVYSNKLVI